ncbi:MAG: hypothetical protein ACFFG0_50535 [Candidatus Thorarchaeota archaeon]
MLENLYQFLMDVFMHRFNSMLWPFVDPNEIVGILTFAFEGNIDLGSIIASILLHTIMGLLMIVILVKSRRNLWELILVGNIYSKTMNNK